MSKSKKGGYLAPSLGSVFYDSNIVVRPSQGGGIPDAGDGDDFGDENNSKTFNKAPNIYLNNMMGSSSHASGDLGSDSSVDSSSDSNILPGVSNEQITDVIPVPETPGPDTQ